MADSPDSRGSAGRNYELLLDQFNGSSKSNRECIQYLMSQGFTSGQARNASYQYRKRRGLVPRQTNPSKPKQD